MAIEDNTKNVSQDPAFHEPHRQLIRNLYRDLSGPGKVQLVSALQAQIPEHEGAEESITRLLEGTI